MCGRETRKTKIRKANYRTNSCTSFFECNRVEGLKRHEGVIDLLAEWPLKPAYVGGGEGKKKKLTAHYYLNNLKSFITIN